MLNGRGEGSRFRCSSAMTSGPELILLSDGKGQNAGALGGSLQAAKSNSSPKGVRARVTCHTRPPTCHSLGGVFGFVIGGAIGSSALHRLLISYCEMQAWRTMLHYRNVLRFTDPCRILPSDQRCHRSNLGPSSTLVVTLYFDMRMKTVLVRHLLSFFLFASPSLRFP